MMKNRWIRFCLPVLCLLLLTGCAEARRVIINTSPDPLPEPQRPAVQELPAPDVQPELDAPEKAVLAAEESVQPEEPEAPLLEKTGELRMLGVPVTVLTDGETRYVSAAETLRAAGLDVQEEDGSLSFELDGLCELESGSPVFMRGGVQTDMKAKAWLQEDDLYAPLDMLTELLSLEYGITEAGTEYYAKRTALGEIPPNVNVPILMYHAVSDDCWGYTELFVSPSEMEKQLAWLTENGYDAIWMEDLDHLEDYDKPVILTFDDGYDDNYTELFPLLKKYNVKATFFVIAGSFGQPHKMTAEQVTEVAQSGLVSVQSHSMTHPYLNSISEADLEWELGECQRVIASLTGKIPNVICYPSGGYNQLTIDVAKRNGYDYGIRMAGYLYNTSVDPFHIQRCYIARESSLEEFKSYLMLSGG